MQLLVVDVHADLQVPWASWTATVRPQEINGLQDSYGSQTLGQLC